MNKFLSILFLLAMCAACVPGKRFADMERQANNYRREAGENKVEAELLSKKNKQLEADMAKQKEQVEALKQDTTLMGMKIRTLLNQMALLENDLRALADKLGDNPEYRSLMRHLQEMQDQYADSETRRYDVEKAIEEQKKILDETNRQLAESEEALAQTETALKETDSQLRNKESELQNTAAELQSTAAELQSRTAELQNRTDELMTKDTLLNAARADIAAQAERLRELEAALAQKDKEMAELRNNIASALTDFNSDELTINHREGKVYVSLEEKLLFESGKYDVNQKGQEALKKIASVLASQKQLNIVVEGHTDDVPFHGQVIEDNWDLSVKRATSVVRILLATGNIPANRIQAAGRADNQPIDDSRTQDARRKNRRTEIILTPDLQTIMQNL